jgi:hypothetical protein
MFPGSHTSFSAGNYNFWKLASEKKKDGSWLGKSFPKKI